MSMLVWHTVLIPHKQQRYAFNNSENCLCGDRFNSSLWHTGNSQEPGRNIRKGPVGDRRASSMLYAPNSDILKVNVRLFKGKTSNQ